ncbi:thiamine monophosphate synthase [Herbaspirillum sp. CF444]|uniref:thiamine phosphate synthase n=1 Tax=Herbaspirillum sp. CF444 TaxID=1144319 RepID=UPI0002723988|nr:thiamine phosphate synthase [Herbaspirillum sp. CF444]EJL94417.1 thiamine monophosphate synthase [Herbaspirillum sp. CF444]
MTFEEPELYLITPEPEALPFFLEVLGRSLSSGVKMVQLRSKKLDKEVYSELAQSALKVCREYGARLILNGPLHDLECVDADGIHLDSCRLLGTQTHPPGYNKLISASCHSLEELMHAKHIGVDFVTLSPVLATKSHPDATPIGWRKFSEMANSVSLPVYALGGMTRLHVSLAKSFGACGVAAIRGLWADFDEFDS